MWSHFSHLAERQSIPPSDAHGNISTQPSFPQLGHFNRLKIIRKRRDSNPQSQRPYLFSKQAPHPAGSLPDTRLRGHGAGEPCLRNRLNVLKSTRFVKVSQVLNYFCFSWGGPSSSFSCFFFLALYVITTYDPTNAPNISGINIHGLLT